MLLLKVQSFLNLAALLLFCTIPTESKVVHSLADCAEFFLHQSPPNIPGILEQGSILDQNRYKLICQTFENTRTFVTLYDTTNKIPVFSASKYRGYCAHKVNRPYWMIEPQLENNWSNDNMRRVQKKRWYKFQAGTINYENDKGLDKGHLLPYSYGLNEYEKKSTCTLTNIVPQVDTFNKGRWNRMEQCVRCVLNEYCKDNNNEKEGFVVIGAQPSESNVLKGVNIPKLLWSAFCCYSSSLGKWLASAHWGENTEQDDNDLQTKTLAELQSKLGGQFNMFPGTQCPLHTTVSEIYPELDIMCHCLQSTTSAPPVTTSAQITATSIPSTIITSSSGHPSTTSGHSATTSVPTSTPTTHLSTLDTTLQVTTTPPFSVSATSQKSQNGASSSYLPSSSETATIQSLEDCMNRLNGFNLSQRQFLCIRHIYHQGRYRYCQLIKQYRFSRKLSKTHIPRSIYATCKDYK